MTLLVDDNLTCLECGAYFEHTGYCSNGHLAKPYLLRTLHGEYRGTKGAPIVHGGYEVLLFDGTTTDSLRTFTYASEEEKKSCLTHAERFKGFMETALVRAIDNGIYPVVKSDSSFPGMVVVFLGDFPVVTYLFSDDSEQEEAYREACAVKANLFLRLQTISRTRALYEVHFGSPALV